MGGPHLQLEERTVLAGREEPLPIRPIPDAPNPAHLLGPGMVLTALAVGLGETFMWPRLVLVFGPEIRWMFLVGVTLQAVVTIEMARWAMATGESIFFGAARLHRAIMWFFWAAAMLVYAWPGHVSLGARALETLLGLPWQWGAVLGLLSIGALITAYRGVVYTFVEGVLSTLISVLVLGSALVASLVGSWSDVWATLRGLGTIGYLPAELFDPAWFPVIVGSIAFAGPSGMQQMWYTLFLRDKGAGMGAYIPRIRGLLSDREEETMPSRGFTFDAGDPEELKKWRGWLRWVKFDAWVLFWGVTMLTTLIYTVLTLAASRIDPGVRDLIAAGDSTKAIDAMAQAFAAVGGPVLRGLFYTFVALVGWKMSFGIFDAFSRGQADMTYYFFPGARRFRISRLYYAFLWGIIGFGILTLLTGQEKGPAFIIDVLAFLSAFVMGAYCLLLLFTNNRLLPAPLRPGWASNVLLALAACLYLGGLFYSLLVLGALPKG